MIRAAVFATFVLALASPALAQDTTSQEVGKSFYDVDQAGRTQGLLHLPQ